MAVTSSGQTQGFSHLTYDVGQRVSYQAMQPSYPLPSGGSMPAAPETTAHQHTYQEPAELFTYENIPTSPPAYSEIFGQPGDQAPPLSAKKENVQAELDHVKS